MSSNSNYPEHLDRMKELMGKLGEGIPNTLGAFSKLHHAASEAGALDTKTKELIALAIAIAIRCDGCIAFHTNDALRAGATEAEILETIGVAILMGGGPAVMYGCETYEAMKQFLAQKA
ncbi:MAG: carboxymuconolactone decarboxylase family protein [Anaerolineae bacterium]|jgi:AhpD family alkylhydroperoxidase|nr:carboxymuconolactone decarboxylase family protein [Anaerolineae bacterium]